MRKFPVPLDLTEEEKIIGGHLSLRQGFYILLSLLSPAILFIKILPMALRLFILPLLIITPLLFAFINIQDTRLDKLVVLLISYVKRKKRFFFERNEE